MILEILIFTDLIEVLLIGIFEVFDDFIVVTDHLLVSLLPFTVLLVLHSHEHLTLFVESAFFVLKGLDLPFEVIFFQGALLEVSMGLHDRFFLIVGIV